MRIRGHSGPREPPPNHPPSVNFSAGASVSEEQILRKAVVYFDQPLPVHLRPWMIRSSQAAQRHAHAHFPWSPISVPSQVKGFVDFVPVVTTAFVVLAGLDAGHNVQARILRRLPALA